MLYQNSLSSDEDNVSDAEGRGPRFRVSLDFGVTNQNQPTNQSSLSIYFMLDTMEDTEREKMSPLKKGGPD